MSNTFFQAVAGLPQMGFAGLSAVPNMKPNDAQYQGVYDAARQAIETANGYAIFRDSSKPGVSAWSELINLINDLAAIDRGDKHLSDNGGWAATVAEEIRQRTGRVLAYVPATAVAQTAVQLRPDLAAVIESFYRTYYNRGSDAGGLEFYTQQLIDGVPQATIQTAFINSDEYRAVHPTATTTTPPAVITTTPPVTQQPASGVQPTSGVLPSPVVPGTITLPIIGTISTKTALLAGAAIGAYFFFSD